MPERDRPLDLLYELRDLGVTPPDDEALHARVSAAIGHEIQREGRPGGDGSNGISPGQAAPDRFGRPRRRLGSPRLTSVLVPAIGVLVVAFVVATFLGLRASGPRSTTPGHQLVTPSRGSVELVYEALPNPPGSAVTRDALERTVENIRVRLRSLGVGGAQVSVSGANEITVALPIVSDTTRVEKAVGTVAQLSFYDWEANVLTPNGKTAASQLQDRNPTALKISQGAGSLPPGSPGAGSMGLYPAVLLASEQPENASSANSRITPQYFLFGAAGSAACEAAANANGTVPAAGQHCLLSGPADNKSDLLSGLPPGVSASEGQILSVPRGTVVLQAISPNFARPVSFSDPNAQFFVLTDNVALRGSDITNPEQSTDPSTHKPDITFGFTSEGKTMFQRMTADVARRGSLVSDLGQTLNQHFAVVLDHQLIAVPYIDYKIYPDGVTANAADLSSGLTAASTRTLAAALRLGALPLNLKLICGPPAATPCHFPRER